MKTTYLVEKKTNLGHDVLGYFHSLKDAKSGLLSYPESMPVSILCIKGVAFGEGFHKYRLLFVGITKDGKSKWKRVTHNLSSY